MVKDAILFADGIMGLVLNDFTDQATAAKEIKELASYITEGIKNRKGYDFDDDNPKSGIFKSHRSQ